VGRIDTAANLTAVVAGFLLFLVLSVAYRAWGSARIERYLRGGAAFLASRGLFRVPVGRDEVRINLFRILVGVLFLVRSTWTAVFLFDSTGSIGSQVAGVVVLLLGIMFTVGLMTPIASILLLFTNVMLLDYALGTYSLGSDVFLMLLLTFAFVPAGTRLSLDAAIMAQGGRWASAIGRIYDFFGRPTLYRLIGAKFLCLLSYSMLCLYSVSLHISEPFWLSGEVVLQIVTSSYLSRHYAFFRELITTYPMAITLGVLSMRIMIAWYIAFLPCILIGGWLRRAVILWAFVFFCASLFVLQVSFLPYYEFTMLGLLFWNNWPFNRWAGARAAAVGDAGRPREISPAPSGMPLHPSRISRATFNAFVSIHLVLALAFAVFLPVSPLFPPPPLLKGVMHVYGMMEINVFNKEDLYMGEHWFTIETIDESGAAHLVPFTGPDGERLAWHTSDRVYFGVSLRWRRIYNFKDDFCYSQRDWSLMRNLLRWSQEWASEPVRAYRLAYYFQPSIDLSDLTNLKVAPIQTVCTVVLDRHGTVLSQERGNYVGLSKASSGAN